METAPNTRFPYFTPLNGLTNSLTFTEGPSGLLALPNPFTITRTEAWTVSTFIVIDLFLLTCYSSHREGYSFSLMQ